VILIQFFFVIIQGTHDGERVSIEISAFHDHHHQLSSLLDVAICSDRSQSTSCEARNGITCTGTVIALILDVCDCWFNQYQAAVILSTLVSVLIFACIDIDGSNNHYFTSYSDQCWVLFHDHGL